MWKGSMNKSLYQANEVKKLQTREWVPTRLQIRQYAEASGDFNPIHLDDRYAQEVGLGGVIAHGMLTMAQCAAMITDWVGDKGIIIELSVRFEGMVRPDECIRFNAFVRKHQGDEMECEVVAFKDTEERVLSGFVVIKLLP